MPPKKVQVVLIDDNDKIVGYKEKFAAHKVPVPLHRAISIVIFNKDKNQILITQRAKTKPTWPLFWSNTVCSHPYDGESYQEAADRRIFEEAGFRTKLTEKFRFVYEAVMDNNVWGEHEYDVVFTGIYEGKVNPDPNEIADYRWIEVQDLKKDLKENPDKYTPWFRIILEKFEV
jgi:isopentenyl-diphosphate delta-isomerase